MVKKFATAASLENRRPNSRKPKPKILIICEGKVTEPTYFKDFKRNHGSSLVTVEPIGACGVPLSVVERAILEKTKLLLEAKQSRDSFDLEFEVWAVFDRDSHPIGQVPQALELAKSNGIAVAYSNPCFEVWGLMHFSCYGRPGHHHEAQAELKNCLAGYCHQHNPIFDVAMLKDRYEAAVKNARLALELRQAEGQVGGDPSTTVFRLTERIRTCGRASGRA